jgi:hypothetical protein
MRRYKGKPHNRFYFWIVVDAVIGHCFFSIREVTSVAIIAGDMQAMTDVSEMAQKLMSPSEGAMAIINCADTGRRGAHHTASAAFEDSSSQLEELGFEYEVTSDGVFFSRSGTAVDEYGPETGIAASVFLGLSGAVELGSLDQVVDVAAYKGFHRCPVLVCPRSKVKGAKSTYYKLCANPSKFHVNGRHALLRSAQVYLQGPPRRS